MKEKKAAVLDRRRNAYRNDLADERLRGQVAAPNYVIGALRQVVRPAVAVRGRPQVGVALDTEALFGEMAMAFEEANGWSWVQLQRDGYVGYVPTEALASELTATTHRVKAIGTFVYPVPDIKSPPLMHLSINAELAVAESGDKFSRLRQGGYVATRHISERTRYARDFVEVAEQLIGTPYLWGGRTRIGIDCSGLVQVSLQAAGLPAPRDTDMQEAEIGAALPVPGDLEGLERGDLVFWKGHVGIMADGIMMIHANAHHMAVVVETLPEAAQRIARAGSPIVAIRRPSSLGAAAPQS